MNIEDLPLYYKDSPERMREVGAFVRDQKVSDRWLFHSRGSAKEAVLAIKRPPYGWSGGIGTRPREDVRLVLDAPTSVGGLDNPWFDWSGPKLTVDEFFEWYDSKKTLAEQLAEISR